MKKYSSFFIFLFIFSYWASISAQNKESKSSEDSYNKLIESLQGCKECRLSEGSCKDIIELLRETQGSDSIAIEIFKEEYKIINMRNDEWMLKKNYTEVIQYFTLEENKIYYCRLKKLKLTDPVLLDD